MFSNLPTIDYIVILLRLFLKALGVYVLLNLNLSNNLALISISVLILSELYEFPLMYLAQKSRKHRTIIFLILGVLNVTMVLGILFFIDQLHGDLYLFLVATIIGISIGGGMTAGTVSGLIAAIGYLFLAHEGPLTDLSVNIRAVFILFIGTIIAILSEMIHQLNSDIVRVQEDKTQYHKIQTVKEKFITTASHQLRTPLTVIKGYAELLTNPKTTEAERDRAQHSILKQVDDLETLTEKLIHLASIQTITQNLKLQSAPIDPFLDKLTELYQSRAEHKSINFKYSPDESIKKVRLEFDPEQLQVAISNLLANAIKYTEPKGIVRLSATASERQIFISVSDTGKGIPPEDIENLFSSFYHAGSPLDSQEGAGIGLFVTKEIIKAHGGSIKVESKLGKGTTFTITLPINSVHQLLMEL